MPTNQDTAQESLAGKSCGKILWENLAGQGGGQKANLRKTVIGGNLAFGIWRWGANQDPAEENLAGKSCGKFLQEILMGKSCRTGRRGKSQFKKGSDWCKFSIWNWVMPTNQDTARENLAGNSCRKFLQENLVGKSCGTGRRGKSQFKKGSDWWKFSIWNRVMGSQPIRI